MSSIKSQSRALPARPNLEQLKKQARALLRAWQQGEPSARARWVTHHPRAAEAAEVKLADALLVLAREHGFASFPKLKAELERRISPEPVVLDGSNLPSLLGGRPLVPFGSLHLAAELVPVTSGPVLVVWRDAVQHFASIAEPTLVCGANGASLIRLDYRARARFDWRDATSARVTPIVDVPPSRAEAARLCERVLGAIEPLAQRNEWVSRPDLERCARAGDICSLLAHAAAHCDPGTQQSLLEARDLRQMVALLVSALGTATGAPNPRPPERSSAASASLVVLHAAHHPHLVGRCYPLNGAANEIGRGSTCAVPLLGAAISRQHARIVRSGAEYVLEDCGSTNGSFLNDDAEPSQRATLRDGDRLKLGDAILGFVDGSSDRLRELVRLSADHDALTRTLRERSFWLETERAVREARRTGSPLSLLLVEPAGRATLERQAGALAGEALLSVAAESVRRVLGGAALIGRSENDRLLVTLPECDELGARRLAEQLTAVEQRRWGHTVSFTPSVGVAGLRATGGVAELVAEAERGRPRAAA